MKGEDTPYYIAKFNITARTESNKPNLTQLCLLRLLKTADTFVIIGKRGHQLMALASDALMGQALSNCHTTDLSSWLDVLWPGVWVSVGVLAYVWVAVLVGVRLDDTEEVRKYIYFFQDFFCFMIMAVERPRRKSGMTIFCRPQILSSRLDTHIRICRLYDE